MSALSDLATAQGIDRYVEKKVSTELIRQRPAPRYATVVGIDTDSKIAEVSFVGEDSVVKVPYTNIAPSEIGQEVRIEGIPGDRYITAIRGLSADENKILDLGENLELTKNDIAAALQGDYAGDDPILGQIKDWAEGILGGGVGEFIGSIFTGGGLFNLGQLTNKPINLISYTGEFDLSNTVKTGEGWSWDENEGHTNPGSAKFTASEAVGGVLTPPRPARVEPGKTYPVEAFLKWQDIVATGEAFSIDITWYRRDRTQISTTVAASISDPASSADWYKLSGNVIAPEDAFWAAVFFRVGPLVTAGYVWFDDVGIFANQASLPQILIANLPEDLQNLFGWLEALVNQFLGALGIPAIGTLFDKIADLSDEIESWFGNTESLAGDFSDLIHNLINNPIAVLGAIPQALVTGLPSALTDFLSMFGQFSDISQGIPTIPINSLVQGFKDGWGNRDAEIADLQDKTQALEGVQGYRATYMPVGSGTYPVGNWKWLGFTATVGPSVGTTVTSEGMIVLHSKGLWRSDCQVYFSWEAVLDVIEVEIVVFDEFGSVYGKRSLKLKTGTGTNSQYTATCNYTFVVPRPGFGVRVQARTDALGREILTGLQYTSFTVNKWSSETE